MGAKNIVPSIVETVVSEGKPDIAIQEIIQLAPIIRENDIKFSEITVQAIQKSPDRLKYIVSLYPYFKDNHPETLQRAESSIQKGDDKHLKRLLSTYKIILGEGDHKQRQQQFEKIYEDNNLTPEDMQQIIPILSLSADPPDIVNTIVEKIGHLGPIPEVAKSYIYAQSVVRGNMFEN